MKRKEFIAIIILVFVITSGLAISRTIRSWANNQEIEAHLYHDVIRWKHYFYIRPMIKEAMEDCKITNAEYRAMYNKAEELNRPGKGSHIKQLKNHLNINCTKEQ